MVLKLSVSEKLEPVVELATTTVECLQLSLGLDDESPRASGFRNTLTAFGVTVTSRSSIDKDVGGLIKTFSVDYNFSKLQLVTKTLL